MSKAMFVFCTLPHASLVINGIDFEPCPGGVVSVDPVEGEDADRFAAIEGYSLVDEKPSAPKRAAPKAEKADKPATTRRNAAKGDAPPTSGEAKNSGDASASGDAKPGSEDASEGTAGEPPAAQ